MMAQKYNLRPAEYVGIRDECIAFYFDVECTEILLEHEIEREAGRLEAMSLGAIQRQLTNNVNGPARAMPTAEITSSNFRDQGF